MLLENEELLAEVKMESKYRKNKNNVSARMCLLINRIERNLIKIGIRMVICLGKQTPPEVLADPQHVIKEKERFLRFYQKRNSKKPVLPASKVKDRNSEHI